MRLVDKLRRWASRSLLVQIPVLIFQAFFDEISQLTRKRSLVMRRGTASRRY